MDSIEEEPPSTDKNLDEVQKISQQMRNVSNQEQKRLLLQKRKELVKELEASVTNPPPHPNFLSNLFFAWVTPTVRLGRRRQLLLNDLPGVPIRARALYVSKEFDETYAEKQHVVENRKYLLFNVFKTLYGREWLVAVTLYILSQLLTVVNPILLLGFIHFIEDLNSPYILGWLYGMGMVALPLGSAFCLNHSVAFAQKVASKIRVALNVAMYDKALRLSLGHDGASVGEIIDLINNDANRILNSFHEIIFGVIAPFQIIMLPNVFIAKKMHLSRKRMLAHTDNRLRSVAEFVQGIRSIKCYVWEEFFLKRIFGHRRLETVEIYRFSYLKATLYFLMGVLPSIVSLVTFVGYVLTGNNFTPSKAFVTLSLLNLIRFPLYFIPVAVLNISANIVAFGRIQRFLDQPEVSPVKQSTDPEKKIVIRNGQFNWIAQSTPPTLSKIDFEVRNKLFVMIVGSVGSGKSTLLQAALGEVTMEVGAVEVSGDVAYVPQQPWILNATFKDNIIMGSDYDETRFKTVTSVCALDADIALLPAGVMTEIGEKGINLSGGQQQRLSLARAIYSNRDVLLMDDCLSAVDQRVSWHIFEKCITGYLANKTVVMVTNNLSFLPYADRIVVLKKGEIVAQMSKEEFSSETLQRSLEKYGITLQTALNKEPQRAAEPTAIDNPASQMKRTSPLNRRLSAGPSKGASGARKFSQIRQEEDLRAILIQDEERMSGNIPWSVYSQYIHTGGVVTFTIVVLFFIFGLACHSGADYWLSVWTTNRLGWTSVHYLEIYVIFGGVELFLQSVGSFSIVGFGLRASCILHDKMVNSLGGATVQFFDTILNRFSRDQDMLDTGLTERMYQFFASLLYIVSTIVILGLTSYWISIAILPIVAAYFFAQKLYRKSSIELKRLEGVSKSPLLAQMVETLAGLQSIRAFHLGDRFSKLFHEKVDKMNTAYYFLVLSTQWLGLILDLLGVLVMLVTVVAIILQRTSINPGLVGLAIVYATSLRYALQFAVSSSTQTEIAMNGTERVLEYTRLQQEPPPPLVPVVLPENWPTTGRIDYDDVSVKYRVDLDPVLSDLNCTIIPGEKVGIVGRTGAGKSTLAASLFRLVDTNQGEIRIDGLAIKDLRAKLTILPQMPMLFLGTIRENLDPFVKYTDQELWEVLEVVQLRDFVAVLPLKLESPVDENGDNLSVGQKQLFCLARALLQKSKILVLDEAMANVDLKTEGIIQEAIESHLQSCTVLTVAHRLASILNSDRIMVLDKGRLVEFDQPSTLLNRPTLFRTMVSVQTNSMYHRGPTKARGDVAFRLASM